MPVSYAYDKQKHLLIWTATGESEESDWRNTFVSVMSNPDVQPDFALLADIRGLKSPIPTNFIMGAAEQIMPEKSRHRRWAVVGFHTWMLGIKGLVAALIAKNNIELKFFDEYDEALQWVSVPNN